MARVELANLGTFGVHRDRRDYTLAPEAFSVGNNIRFNELGASRISGHFKVFGNPLAAPVFLTNVPDSQGVFWVYTSLTGAYVVQSGAHTNITRTSGAYTVSQGGAWNRALFGGILILNNGADIPQWWSNPAVTTKLADLPDWPTKLRAKIIRGFGPYLVAFNLVDDGALLPHTLQWSHKADPGTVPASWDYADPTVDAGRTHLTDVQGGPILEALALGNQMVIYKENSTHLMRFVGGSDMFAFDLLFTTSGVLGANCVAPILNGTRHAVLTKDDLIIHGGSKEAERPLEGKNRRTVFAEIARSGEENCFVFNNQLTNEVWVVYPEAGATAPTRAFIWNYKDNTQTFRDFRGVSMDYGNADIEAQVSWNQDLNVWNEDDGPWSDSVQSRVLFVDGTAIFALDLGWGFNGSVPVAFLERTGVSIDGKDRFGQPRGSVNSVKLLKRIWPKVSGSSLLNIQVGSQQDVNSPVRWSSSKVFNPKVDTYLDFIAQGKLLAYRIESQSNDPWTLEGMDLEITRVSEL